VNARIHIERQNIRDRGVVQYHVVENHIVATSTQALVIVVVVAAAVARRIVVVVTHVVDLAHIHDHDTLASDMYTGLTRVVPCHLDGGTSVIATILAHPDV